jgi:hypothetical protein
MSEIPEDPAAEAAGKDDAPRKGQARSAPRAERGLDLAMARYTLRRDLKPYILHDGIRYDFSGPNELISSVLSPGQDRFDRSRRGLCCR